ncbi:MAG: hypothetical protein JWO82_3645 [Akkermansiaceae bacterium]|nr:hypothetical protein [Akkermansiaceae bacterium]
MIRRLLQPTPELLNDPSPRLIGATAAITLLSLALYGFSVGYWRSAEMGLYVAVKMPLLIACTLICNASLNGMFGLLLGGLGFRQSWLALLSCFATASLILGSLAPITFLMALQFPDSSSPEAITAHSVHQLFHIVLIAIAGIAGTLSLHRILKATCPTPLIARATLISWLAGNGFLGAQFSWIFRPFFGQPRLEVTFLRPHPMQGSFYEDVLKAFHRLTGFGGVLVDTCLILFVICVSFLAYRLLRRLNRKQPSS